MAKWIEYLLKKKPADEDMLMLEDAESHNNKRVSFSGIADWLIEKMKKNNLISGALRFKGSSSYAALPGKGAAENDYYYCTDGDGTHGPGYYAWNGSSWIWIGSNDKGIDSTLQVEGAAAESAATGAAIASLKEEIGDVYGIVLGDSTEVVSYEQMTNPVSNGAYQQNGKFFSSSGYRHFVYACSPSDKFKVTATANGIADIVIYFNGEPSAQNLIGSYSKTPYSEATLFTDVVVTPPIGCKYIVFNSMYGNGQFVVKKEKKEIVFSENGLKHDVKIVESKVDLLIENMEPLYQEREEYIKPYALHKGKGCYVVTDNHRFFYKTTQYTNVAVYKLIKDKTYTIKANLNTGIQDAYATAETYFEPPTNGYGTGVVYIDQKKENSNGTFTYTITPNVDCYLYLQIYSSLDGNTSVQSMVKALVTERLNEELIELRGEVEEIKQGITSNVAYKVNGDAILLASKYDNEKDIVYKLCKHGVNALFDFYAFYLFDNSDALPKVQEPVSSNLLLWGNGDWHAPYQFKVRYNIDGDTPDGQYFTGGMHGYRNATTNTTATARCVKYEFYVNNKKLSDGDTGYASEIVIYWENMVQACNTMKSDGSGREALKECHTLVYDGKEFKSHCEFIPLEDINISLWYGVQMMYAKGDGIIRFLDGANRIPYATNISSECGDATSNMIRVEKPTLTQEMIINPIVDLGKRTNCYSNLTKAMFGVYYGKCYATIINNDSVIFHENCVYSLNAIYRFYKP